jgi:hypothetical protein
MPSTIYHLDIYLFDTIISQLSEVVKLRVVIKTQANQIPTLPTKFQLFQRTP